MVKHLPTALLLALLVCSPAVGQEDWTYYRDTFLGPNRSLTMGSCAGGKKKNQKNQSLWDLETTLKDRAKLEELGISATKQEAMMSGQTAAMAVVCPNVW